MYPQLHALVYLDVALASHLVGSPISELVMQACIQDSAIDRPPHSLSFVSSVPLQAEPELDSVT